jgi:hypothetical protein
VQAVQYRDLITMQYKEASTHPMLATPFQKPTLILDRMLEVPTGSRRQLSHNELRDQNTEAIPQAHSLL